MKLNFHSDNGAPCWRCSGTIYSYTVDDCVTYIGARCIGCRADNMFYPPKHCSLDTAVFVSTAHREVSDGGSTLKEQRMIHAHQWGRRDYRDNKPMLVPVFLKDADERDAYMAGYLGERKRAEVQS